MVPATHNDMGRTLVRTIGLARAKAKIEMKDIAYNMRRLCKLRRINPNPACLLAAHAKLQNCT